MMNDSKTAVLLVNLGSPDSPRPRDVRRYLSEFLNDPRVIDLPFLGRFILVNGIIVPFRFRKSAAVYRKLWTENGSPLIYHGTQVRQLLQSRFDESGTQVFLAMRYQRPSLDFILEEIRKFNPQKLIVIPLFPQYASATSGSVFERVMRIVQNWWVIPDMEFVSQFYDHHDYIDAFVQRGREHNLTEYDHVVFSYHGLPERQVDKVYEDRKCSNHSCESEINEENKYCYKATCYATSRAIASRLGIGEEKYTVAFQSRLGKGWIEPFADDVIESLAKKGAKRLLVFSPAFVADCLETTIEIGEEYNELFQHHGGDKVQLVESLNEHPTWINCLEDLVRRRMPA